MNKSLIAAAVAASALLSGCATVFNEANQTVNVTSSNGQKVSGTVDGKPFETPGAVQVLRTRSPKVFNVDAPGCAKQTTVNSDVDVKFFGNILIGGVFGSTTDYSTDKMWKYADSVSIPCSNP